MTVAANTASPFAAHDRQSLAGDRFLVDHGVTVDNLAVDRNDVAGIDDNMIIHRQLGRRHGHDDVVANDPGHSALEFEEFAYGAARAGRGQIADPVAELDQPDHDGAGHRIALHERGGDGERVEDIDVEPALPPPYAPRPQRDRIGVPQHQGHVDGRTTGLRLNAISSDTVGSASGRAAPDRRLWRRTRQRRATGLPPEHFSRHRTAAEDR